MKYFNKLLVVQGEEVFFNRKGFKNSEFPGVLVELAKRGVCIVFVSTNHEARKTIEEQFKGVSFDAVVVDRNAYKDPNLTLKALQTADKELLPQTSVLVVSNNYMEDFYAARLRGRLNGKLAAFTRIVLKEGRKSVIATMAEDFPTIIKGRIGEFNQAILALAGGKDAR